MLLNFTDASAGPLGHKLEHTPPTDRLVAPRWVGGTRGLAWWVLSGSHVEEILNKMVVKKYQKSGFFENFKIYFCASPIMNKHARGLKT